MDHPSNLRDYSALRNEKFDEERVSTPTSTEQIKTERLISRCFERLEQLICLEPTLPQIHRNEHIRFLESGIRHLSTAYECLDSSRPWIVYWILNAAHLLNHSFSEVLLDQIVDFLVKCRSPDGGFGGGPGQAPHLAPTYAAVNSLCIIGTEKAYKALDRPSLKKFLISVHEPNGAFRMHVGGEIDVRGCYCAITAAKLANFSKRDIDEIFENTVEWIVSCQTYEGGIGGAPDLEAHGGYAFCGIAALTLLGSTGKLNLKSLLKWAVNRQMRYEGGFQGRTNKLVDGCYSFWQGASIPIIQVLLQINEPFLGDLIERPIFDRRALQEYVLICCQRPEGGLLDKPGKPPDFYHTCYTLSGVSISQHCKIDMFPFVIGPPENEVMPTHPIYNIPPLAAWKVFTYFQKNTDDMYESEHNSCNIDDSEGDEFVRSESQPTETDESFEIVDD
ncbi:protein farnesyltransferase subunit beta [Bradysia coprophila]|uniref:protein farnesyltransferase subunit beta n=1 Tax=Bradysia coprophila TaxID=38358 RepID=UPI00187D991E|nr:protein farnesyltransferase subunit beta [Bradysia coprophila]